VIGRSGPGSADRVASIAALLAMASSPGLVGCGKRAAPGASSIFDLSGGSDPNAQASDDVPPPDARELEAWTQADQGGEDEQTRLANLVGCVGLRERAMNPSLRSTAIRAMAYCRDFSELPWLAGVATQSRKGAEGTDALDAIVELAAHPRLAVDPEDAAELREGCQALVALSRAAGQPKEHRVLAVRALRMLADRGCVNRADIPVDFDAK
jgi:hypothetical protein